MGFKLIYLTSMVGVYLLVDSILEKYGKFREDGHFSGRTQLDWGNTAQADTAGLGSIVALELYIEYVTFHYMAL